MFWRNILTGASVIFSQYIKFEVEVCLVHVTLNNRKTLTPGKLKKEKYELSFYVHTVVVKFTWLYRALHRKQILKRYTLRIIQFGGGWQVDDLQVLEELR